MEQPRVIVALSGKQRAGKNTAADFLYRLLYSHGFKQIAFADYLKEAVSSAYGVTTAELERMKNEDPDVRSFLIQYAADVKKDDPSLFIRKTLSQPGNLIITDMRYKEEAQAVLNDGPLSFLCRVETPRDLRALRGRLSNELDRSETDLDDYEDWHYVLENWKTLDTLQRQCDVVAESILDYARSYIPGRLALTD